MKYEFFIALRYLSTSEKRKMVSAITLISIFGVFLGVGALLVVLSVMNGFQDDLRQRILGTNTHVVIFKYHFDGIADYDSLIQIVEKHPEVIAASPFIYTKSMVSTKSMTDGVAVWGVEPVRMKKVTEIGKYITKGSLDFNRPEGSFPGIVVGVELASRLKAGLGEKITMTSPFNVAKTPIGMIPKLYNFEVTGIFNSGMYEFNSTYVFISLKNAQDLFKMGNTVSGIEVKVKDIYKAPKVATELISMLGGYPYWANDWIQLNGNLFSALKLEKIGMYIILVLIIIVASFNIIGTLILVTLEKTKDIGILISLGATKKGIMRIFMFKGIIIGVIGTACGNIMGFFLCKLLDTYKFIDLPGDVYFLDTLPVKMEVFDFFTVSIVAILISFVASIYPAIRASKFSPVETLRYG